MIARVGFAIGAIAIVALAGCTGRVGTGWDWNRMRAQPRYSTWGASAFFRDGKAMQASPAGTVPRDMDSAAGTPSIVRGADRYRIFCSPCHGERGNGDGLVGRNMDPPAPPALATAAAQALADSTIGSIIAHGFGRMPPFADQLYASDRAAVIAFLRSLGGDRKATIPGARPR